MLFLLRTKAKHVNLIDDVAEVVSALKLVVYLSEYLADLVFNGVQARSAALETFEIWEELGVNEVLEIIAGHRTVEIGLAISTFGRGPGAPAKSLFEDKCVAFAVEFCFRLLFALKGIEVLEKE